MESCTVQIISVQLIDISPALADPKRDNTSTMCYVCFELPGYSMKETETPLQVLTTPQAGQSRSKDVCLEFSFEKSYDYGAMNSREKRKALDDMLNQYHADVKFTVLCVKETLKSSLCTEIGQAVVRLDNRIARRDDIREESFPLFLNKYQVGSIKISTDLPSLLLSVCTEPEIVDFEVGGLKKSQGKSASSPLEAPANEQLHEPTMSQPAMETCTVQIFSVQFSETCNALKNPDLDDTRCYVLFLLPGFGNNETETPLSLPTPRPGLSRPNAFCLKYNFQKHYDYSFATSYEKRKVLAISLLNQQSIEIPFTVVCEPSDSDSDFFMDLGKAVVNLDSRIARGEDIREESFPLMLNDDQVGSINISMNLPSLLLEVYNELPDAKKSAVKFFN